MATDAESDAVYQVISMRASKQIKLSVWPNMGRNKLNEIYISMCGTDPDLQSN